MEPLIYDDEHSIKLDDFIIHHNVECSQLHDYFDLDTNIEHYFSVLDLEPTNKIKQKKTPKAKPKKTKPIPVIETAQELLDEFWDELIDTGLPTSLVSINNDCIFFYNSPTAEAEMATQIADKIAELALTYNVGLTRPTFWSNDNEAKITSFQSWQPDWETVNSDTFWNTKYPPLKKSRAKKVK
jgi:hypothetical protein